MGRRVAANLLDTAVLVWPFLVAIATASQSLGLAVAAYVLGLLNNLVMGMVNWGLTATRGYTVGQRWMGVWVLDEQTQAPIGWGRAFVRNLVLSLLSFTGVGLLANAFVISGDPRGRGWHDRVGRSVAVTRRGAEGSTPARGIEAAPARGLEPRPLPGVPAPPSLATPQPTSARDVPVVTRATAPGLTPPVVVAQAAAPRTPTAVPLITSVPGFPAPAPAHPPAPAPASVADPVAAPSGPARLSLVTASGTTLPDADHVVVGRDPVTSGAEVGACLEDPARSLSKTHAAFVRGGGKLWVHDLGSTNGVAVVRDERPTLVEREESFELMAGDRVMLGELEIEVEQR
nr:RDD family protein [Nocardioides flavescens]